MRLADTPGTAADVELHARVSRIGEDESGDAFQIEPVEIAVVEFKRQHDIEPAWGQQRFDLVEVLPLDPRSAAVGLVAPLMEGQSPLTLPARPWITQLDPPTAD